MSAHTLRLVALALLAGLGCSPDRAVRPDPPDPPPVPPPAGAATLIAIVPAKSRIDAGESAQFGIVATDAQQRPVAAPPVQWRTSLPAVASVTQAGTVTGLSPGYVQVTASSSSGLGAYIMVHVQRDGVYPDLVAIDPATSSLAACGTLQLAARTVPDVGVPQFAWRSSDTLVVRVDATGLVSGRAAGTASIMAVWLPDTTRRATRPLVLAAC